MSSAKTATAGRPAGWPSLAEIFFGRLANLWRKRRVERATPRRRPQFQSIEPRILLSADLVFNAVDNLAHDDYTLRLDAESGDLQLLDSTTVVASRPLAETTGVVINGEDGWNDSLKIDFSQGGFFSLDGGITFNGGEDGFDALEVTGGTFTSVIHTVTDAGPGLSGTMVYEDGLNPALTINYTGLEPVDMTGSTIADLVFNLPGTNDQAILEDDGTPGNGISQLRSQNATPTFDTTTFTNPTGSLTVNMGGDNGTFTV
ncbi:MAG TPA: LEPR-XLL domain-containing protein, partial [Gemmatimonadales bacterium]|nr:LEPR-XLL domain-containing protein [Gemmatimonadales bacterium]